MDELRDQMAALKEKLDKQAIVNDQLIQDSLKLKMSWVKNYVWGEIVATPFIILLLYSSKTTWHLPWWSFGALSLLLVVSVAIDYYINNHALKDIDYQKDNLLQTAHKLIKMKKQRTWPFVIEGAATLLIMVWTGFDIYQNKSHTPFSDQVLTNLLIGGVIGFTIGIVIAIVVLYKMQRTNDRLVKQIREIMEE